VPSELPGYPPTGPSRDTTSDNYLDLITLPLVPQL